MSRTPGIPIRILYQQLTPATVLKAQNESAEATSGGGARDLRLSPHHAFAPFMERLLPSMHNRVRQDGNTAEVHVGAATWGDGSTEMEIEYWPPTKARPNEGRVARISSIPSLVNPPTNLEGAVVLFVQDEHGLVWVRYSTAAGLKASMPQVSEVIRDCLQRSKPKRIASGYIDLAPNGLGSWCNCEEEE